MPETKDQTNKDIDNQIFLRAKTDEQWIKTIMTDFDAFLLDHAACERKLLLWRCLWHPTIQTSQI